MMARQSRTMAHLRALHEGVASGADCVAKALRALHDLTQHVPAARRRDVAEGEGRRGQGCARTLAVVVPPHQAQRCIRTGAAHRHHAGRQVDVAGGLGLVAQPLRHHVAGKVLQVPGGGHHEYIDRQLAVLPRLHGGARRRARRSGSGRLWRARVAAVVILQGVEVRLEGLVGALGRQRRVPLRVLIDAVLHGPLRCDRASLSPHCGVALREVARQRAVVEVQRVEVVLEGLEAGLLCEIRVPLWVIHDAVLHRPHHRRMALLTLNGRVAAGLPGHRARQGARFLVQPVDVILEGLEAGPLAERRVPLRVQLDAMLLRPRHCRVAPLALRGGVASLLRCQAPEGRW
mmetsp:Transcript_22364/g.56955  ORF Transcript_22364/g.56955 Transcript_22364/m.56955 type:complete len:346 (-) Transcript_22364:122-1159(-)